MSEVVTESAIPAPVEVPAIVPPVEGAPAPAAETPPAETPKAEAKPERSASRFAALARKEAELVRKQRELKAQAAAKEAEIAKQSEAVRQYEAARASAKMNPIKALGELGLSYEDVVKFVLNEEKPTPELEVKSVRDEVESLRKQLEAEKRQFVEAEKAKAEREAQATLEMFRTEVKDFVRENAEKYELTNLYGGDSLVVQVIQSHFEESQKLLSYAEAADLVEQHYEDLARKAQATRKFAATKPAPTPAPAVEPAPVVPTAKTLTNTMTATPASASSTRVRSEEDRIAAALAALNR